jgi:hypothetical protein
MPMSLLANSARSRRRRDDGWKSVGRDAVDVVDHRQFAGALLELRGALGDLGLQPGGKAQVGERNGSLRGEHREQVAVGVVKAAERAFDVAVQVGEQLALGNERRNEARALSRAATRRARGARRARAPPRRARRDGAQQAARVFAGRKQGALHLRALRRVEHEQYALGARELGDFIDQEVAQLNGAAQRVHAHAGVDEALEVDAPAQREVREAFVVGHAAPGRLAGHSTTMPRLTSSLFR